MENSVTEQELTSLLNKLTDEICADQKEMEVLKKRVSSNITLKQALQARLGATKLVDESATYGTRWDNIRKAIQRVMKPRFTQNDVEVEIKRLDPDVEIDRSRLRATLWTFQSKGELIKQVRKGNNQWPALFEKLPAVPAHANGVQNGAAPANEANRRAVGIADNSGQITVGAFEDFISKKSRRMKDVLAQFSVNEPTVRKLLEPASRVFEGEKGWLKLR